jgi:hypothetical protein
MSPSRAPPRPPARQPATSGAQASIRDPTWVSGLQAACLLPVLGRRSASSPAPRRGRAGGRACAILDGASHLAGRRRSSARRDVPVEHWAAPVTVRRQPFEARPFAVRCLHRSAGNTCVCPILRDLAAARRCWRQRLLQRPEGRARRVGHGTPALHQPYGRTRGPAGTGDGALIVSVLSAIPREPPGSQTASFRVLRPPGGRCAGLPAAGVIPGDQLEYLDAAPWWLSSDASVEDGPQCEPSRW